MSRVVLLSLRIVSAALWTLALLLLGIWLVGRVFNDSFRWSQFIFWIPSAFSILMSGIAAALALSLQLFVKGYEQLKTGGPRDERPPFYKRYPRNPYILLCLIWALCASWSAWFEHHMPEWAFLDTGRKASKPKTTMVFWNIGGQARDGWLDELRPIDADLVVVSNQPNWNIVNDFKTLGDERSTTFLVHLFLIHTRLKLREWGFATLGIKPGVGFDLRKSTGQYDGTDPGYSMYLLFDPEGTVKEGTGSPFVVWLMDLPSDPSSSRQRVTREAINAIDSWQGTATVLSAETDSKGEPIWINVPADQLGRRGFPLPDVIIGDFNIPRGSRSLKTLVGNMENAWDQAGMGYTASYPRKVPFKQLDGPGLASAIRLFIPSDIPFFHIDQAFIAPSLHATRYRTMNLGAGTHWAQFLEVQAR